MIRQRLTTGTTSNTSGSCTTSSTSVSSSGCRGGGGGPTTITIIAVQESIGIRSKHFSMRMYIPLSVCVLFIKIHRYIDT